MKKIKLVIISVLVMAIIMVIAIYLSPEENNTQKVEKKDYKSIEISAGEQVYTYNSYIYIYGKAGLEIIKDDKVILQDTFSLESPYISTSYNKIAIGDKNGKVIRIYSNEGHMYTVNEPTNVLGFYINKNGYLCTIVKNEGNYEVKVYNNTGKIAYAIKDISYKEGVPFSASLSEDNNILAISYIKATAATVDSSIVFYSIKDDQLFGGHTKQEQMVTIVKFVGNTNLVCISEKEIFIIKANAAQTSEQAKEIYKKPLNNVLKSIGFIDGVGYSICYGQPIVHSKDSMQENSIFFYNQAGGEIGKYYDKSFNVSNIFVSKYGAILQDGRLFVAVDTSGKKIWQYQATQDIKEVRFYDNDNRALIVTNNEIKIVKIDKTLVDKQIDPNNTEQTTEKATEKTTEKTPKNEIKEDNSKETTKKEENSNSETKKDNKEENTETTIKNEKENIESSKKEESTTTEKVDEKESKGQ